VCRGSVSTNLASCCLFGFAADTGLHLAVARKKHIVDSNENSVLKSTGGGVVPLPIRPLSLPPLHSPPSSFPSIPPFLYRGRSLDAKAYHLFRGSHNMRKRHKTVACPAVCPVDRQRRPAGLLLSSGAAGNGYRSIAAARATCGPRKVWSDCKKFQHIC